jgi:Glycosyl hydrolase family 12
MWNLSPYFVADDMWNISGYSVSQMLYACSYSDWYVVATMDNSKGDGAVKTYPNSHRDFDSSPEISSLSSITSTFTETSPDSGIYEDAYDIWLNGIASAGSTEVMISTDNHGQTPAGSLQTTVTIDGRSYAVWKTTGNYIAFVASTNFTSGTVNLLDFFQWLMTKGWIPDNSTLGQVDYGPELVSTNGVPATFTFSDFSVNAG